MQFIRLLHVCSNLTLRADLHVFDSLILDTVGHVINQKSELVFAGLSVILLGYMFLNFSEWTSTDYGVDGSLRNGAPTRDKRET